MTEAKKPAPDWERIEIDYRAGVLSTRELGVVHGVSHTAINKRAKAGDWSRDLKAKIQAKAEALVSRQAVSTEVSSQRLATEREVIDANAQQIARVRGEHRSDIRRGRALVLELLGELEGQTLHREVLEELGELMRRENESGIDRLNDTYHKIIGSAGRIDSVKKVSEALKNLIGLEREAYGLNEPEKPAGDLKELTDAELETRIRDLESRTGAR